MLAALPLEKLVGGVGEVMMCRWKSLQNPSEYLWSGLFRPSTPFGQNAFVSAGFDVILQCQKLKQSVIINSSLKIQYTA